MDFKVISDQQTTERLTGNSFPSRSIETIKGTKTDSDVHLLCDGFHPSSDLNETTDSSLVLESSFFKANDRLQVANPKYRNIFVLCNLSDHNWPKWLRLQLCRAITLEDNSSKECANNQRCSPRPLDH